MSNYLPLLKRTLRSLVLAERDPLPRDPLLPRCPFLLLLRDIRRRAMVPAFGGSYLRFRFRRWLLLCTSTYPSSPDFIFRGRLSVYCVVVGLAFGRSTFFDDDVGFFFGVSSSSVVYSYRPRDCRSLANGWLYCRVWAA